MPLPKDAKTSKLAEYQDIEPTEVVKEEPPTEEPEQREFWEEVVIKCSKLARAETLRYLSAMEPWVGDKPTETVVADIFKSVLESAQKIIVTTVIQEGKAKNVEAMNRRGEKEQHEEKKLSYRDLTETQKKIFYYLSDRAKEEKFVTPVRAILASRKLGADETDLDAVLQVNPHLGLESRNMKNHEGEYESLVCVIWHPKE